MSTLSQLRSLVRVNINQTDETNTDFSNIELNGFLNEGTRFLGALVKKPIDHAEVQVEQDKPAYTLPSDAIIMLTAYFGNVAQSGDNLPLRVIPEEALKEIAPSWMDETVGSQGRPAYAVLLDRRTVLVYPRPNATESATGKTLKIGYVYQPAAMSGDGEEPDIPIVYHDLIAQYALQMCYFSKLNKPDLGAGILKSVVDKAKKFESLIIKDSDSTGFFWGSAIDPEDEGGLRFR